MYPKVVRARGLLYFQVRRAASSAIQHAMGYDFIDWRISLKLPDTFLRFTHYRNTWDKLRSLYFNFVQGEGQSFGLVLSHKPSFQEFVERVCETNDVTCDEHLVSQDWETFIPNLTIFHNMRDLERMTKLSVPIFGKLTPHKDLCQSYTTHMRDLMLRRYPEILRHGYELRASE